MLTFPKVSDKYYFSQLVQRRARPSNVFLSPPALSVCILPPFFLCYLFVEDPGSPILQGSSRGPPALLT